MANMTCVRLTKRYQMLGKPRTAFLPLPLCGKILNNCLMFGYTKYHCPTFRDWYLAIQRIVHDGINNNKRKTIKYGNKTMHCSNFVRDNGSGHRRETETFNNWHYVKY